MTVLSLTWESPYLEKTVFILRQSSGVLTIISPYCPWRDTGDDWVQAKPAYEVCAVVAAKHPYHCTWWRHDRGRLSPLLALCEGNPPVTSLRKATAMRSFDIFFVVSLDKLSNNQSSCRWDALRRSYNVTVIYALGITAGSEHSCCWWPWCQSGTKTSAFIMFSFCDW